MTAGGEERHSSAGSQSLMVDVCGSLENRIMLGLLGFASRLGNAWRYKKKGFVAVMDKPLFEIVI